MELGIDVGDLDQVIQLDAPGSRGLVQRIGRTGRRTGSRSGCTFACGWWQAVALLQLAESSWVEDNIPLRALHVRTPDPGPGGSPKDISHHAVLPVLSEGYQPPFRIAPQALGA